MTYFNVFNASLEELNQEFAKSVRDVGEALIDLNASLNGMEEGLKGSPYNIWEENQSAWNKEYQVMVDDIQRESNKSFEVHDIFLEGDRAGQRIMSGG